MRVLIAGPQEFVDSCLRRVEEKGLQAVAAASSASVAADLLLEGGFDAAVLGFPLDECLVLLRECPPPAGVPVLVSLSEAGPAAWAALAAYGASPVRRGSEAEELSRRTGAAGRPARREVPEEFSDFAAADARERVSAVREETRAGKVVTLRQRVFVFYAPKGGEGKTTLAVAFACTAAKLAGLKVVVVDIDPTREGSDVARRFGFFISRGAKPPATVASWQDFPQDEWRLWETVEKYVVQTEVSNLWILPAPWDVVEATVVTREMVAKIVATLKWHFDLVVVDTPPDLLEGVVEAIDQADAVVLVCRPNVDEADVLAGFGRKTVGRLRFPREKIRLVFNQVPERLPYTTRDVAANAGLIEAAAVPFDPEVAKVRTAGKIPDGEMQSPFGQAVRKMARTLLPEELFPEESRKARGGRRGFAFWPWGRRKPAAAG
ncbi:MAG: AAA family ATPase [Firmicutes bacterium]|nr:AAA family ATPase [Bacillota bacterium]